MHIEKYKNAQVGKILGHNKREHLHYKNESVNLSLSHNNTYFVKRDFDYYEKIISDLYVYGGWKDKTKLKYNSLCNICVYCPKDYEDQNRFFKIMNFVLTERFGKDNVICSVVHRDEYNNGVISPHLHFTFIPTIWNEKKQKYQMSYEKCLAHDFNTFHEEIENLIKEYFPKDNIKLHDEENKDKFYFDNIEDYKKMKLELDNIQNKLNSKNAEFKDLEDKYNDLYVRFQKNIKVIDEQENYIYDLKTKLFKCIDLLNEAERKDIKLLGFSPLSNELDSLYKKVDEIERG